MGKRFVTGSLVFLVALFAGVHREWVRESPLYAGVCTSDVRTFPRLPRLAVDILQRVSAQSAASRPVSCAAPPTTYQSLPSVTGRGGVSVPLSLGTGPGIGTGNPDGTGDGKDGTVRIALRFAGGIGFPCESFSRLAVKVVLAPGKMVLELGV